jgi:hypothetical protein
MSQTPPNGPIQVPGGQPNPGFPSPGGYQAPNAGPFPPTAPQGYPNPAAFPPASYPQQGYGQPGGPAGGGYPMPGGYPQPPAGKASSSKVLLIVIAAVVALALIGGGLVLMAQTPKTPTGSTVPTQPTQPTEPTQTPSTDPTPSSDPTPTAGPTGSPTPANGAVDLGHGVLFAVSDGWQVTQQSASMIQVSDGNALIITQVVEETPSTNALQYCDAYNRAVLKDESGTKFADPEKVSVNLKGLSVGKCLAGFVQASGSSSKQMYLQSFASVRNSDGVVALVSIVFTKQTPQTSFDGANEMIGVVLISQAAG